MAFPQPPNSKSSVRRAGEAVAAGRETAEDIALIDQWRASHGYVLNTFQGSLRGRISRQSLPVEFVQRLKRRKTIIDKLQRKRPDGRHLITDVVAMQDIAGCRLIFDTVGELLEFRRQMHEGFGEHILRNDPSKYDYIENPKDSGYRGVHDIYLHHPRSHKRGDSKNEPWHGLKVEIQFRTKHQNSWATAVEMADLIDRERTKFEFGGGDRGMFFRIASEIIARRHEGITRAFVDKSIDELRRDLDTLEHQLGILNRLEALRAYDGGVDLRRHNVLNIMQDDNSDNGFRLDISTFRSPAQALNAANAAESDPMSINAVYVRSDRPHQLRAAYKNYFSDPTNFVGLLS